MGHQICSSLFLLDLGSEIRDGKKIRIRYFYPGSATYANNRIQNDRKTIKISQREFPKHCSK
jgi:hypothetical protein